MDIDEIAFYEWGASATGTTRWYCPASDIKRNATSVQLAVPYHGSVDSEKIGDTKSMLRLTRRGKNTCPKLIIRPWSQENGLGSRRRQQVNGQVTAASPGADFTNQFQP
jgi:hypothetical protein